MSTVPVETLRGLFLFEGLTDAQLSWIADRGERRTFDAGAVVTEHGAPAEFLFLLLEGRVRMTRPAAGEEVVINETDHVGAYLGAVRAYVDLEGTYQGTVTALEPSAFFTLPAQAFHDLMRTQFPMAVHLLDGLYLGLRASDSTVRQREHLARLGTLSANLAHELNNPAAATVRAAGQLRDRVAAMRTKLGQVAQGHVDQALMQRLVAAQEEVVRRAAGYRGTVRSPVQVSDDEDAFADALEDLGVPDGYDLAPVYAAAGLDAEWLETFRHAVLADAGEDDLAAALRWIGHALETEALLDEIDDASGRISGLVAAVKQYSHLDGASAQEIDLHPGLDATVVMLGHKVGGLEVVREYDRDLPLVPAYPAELNQVWTNLIDNAADAMGGRGRLVLRTARAGEVAVVEVVDDGPGIPPEVQARMFEAFFTTKPPGQGTGLGLDNVRRIVVGRHRGTVDVESGPAGTTVRVALPLAQRLV